MDSNNNNTLTKQHPKHRFAQQPWRLIRDYAGIYGVDMDYSKIEKLGATALSCAMNYGNTFSNNRNLKDCGAWKKFLLKKISNGYKSRQFYQELSEIIKAQEKVNRRWKIQYERYLRDTIHIGYTQPRPTIHHHHAMRTSRIIRNPE